MLLSVLAIGCSDEVERLPVSPTPPQAPAPEPPAPSDYTLYTLSGVVFEETSAGRVPVANVEVYCDSCNPPEGHSLTSTDAAGAYSFAKVASGATPILLSKPGYVLPNQPDQSGPGGLGWMGGVSAIVSENTRLDIRIVRK